MSIITIAIIVVLVSLVLLLLRALLGPTIFDRLLIANSFGTHSVLLIVLLAFFMDAPYFIDIALIYALISFATTIAILKFVTTTSFSDVSDRRES